MIRVGIAGGAGYTGGELIRILLNHPEAEIVFVNSRSNAGAKLYSVHEGLAGDTEMEFTAELPLDAIDVLFMCSGHGESRPFLAANPLPPHLKVIDLAQDFRDESEGFVYGLPEVNRERIRLSKLTANPGCFATCIQLGLLPLAAAHKLTADVAVTAITGSTGAGVKPSATSHFSWRNNNLSVYKAFTHQHLLEINRTLGGLQGEGLGSIGFVPVRGDFPRGIFAVMQTRCDMEEDALRELYAEYYKDAAFCHFVTFSPDMKQVVNTNKALVYVQKHEDRLMIISCIDNLLKGASGQAVQNMNLMFGISERSGLNLKAAGF